MIYDVLALIATSVPALYTVDAPFPIIIRGVDFAAFTANGKRAPHHMIYIHSIYKFERLSHVTNSFIVDRDGAWVDEVASRDTPLSQCIVG